MLPLQPLSPAETLVDGKPKELPLSRKLAMLVIFCFAQFLDDFNNSALFSAIPALDISMGMTGSQSTWIISASQLTFASFLLISGRISDVYNPKIAFIGGMSSLGIISLCTGFIDNKILIIIVRALSGIASSMTIPSALTLIVHVFPDPLQQAWAISLFGGCGAIAAVFGLVIGAMFVEWASYHWVFWFVAIVALGVALLACVLVTQLPVVEVSRTRKPQVAKWKSLDLIGITLLTVALILFIFAVSSGSIDGWGSATVLVTLITSISMMVVFFYWETRIPEEEAAIPPRTWFYNNFSVLFAVALLPTFWWNTVFIIFTTLWQDIFHWSAISSAMHLFPICVTGLAISSTWSLARIFSPKWIILAGLALSMVATVLLALGGGKPEDYWTYVFPALTIGGSGIMITYTQTNIAIFRAAPASMAGTVGAIFNSALQAGSAIGLAAASSIESSVKKTSSGGSQAYAGQAAVFWFLLGIVALEFISVSIFYDRNTDRKSQPEHGGSIHPTSASTRQNPHFDRKSDNTKATTIDNKVADQADAIV